MAAIEGTKVFRMRYRYRMWVMLEKSIKLYRYVTSTGIHCRCKVGIRWCAKQPIQVSYY